MGPETVARFGEIQIDVEEMDAFILSLPARDRPLPGQDLDGWYRKQIRELIFDRLMLDQVKSTGLEAEPGFLRSRREAERRLILQYFYQRLHPETQALDEETLKAAYVARKGQMRSLEKRSAFHIFRHSNNEIELEAAKTELTGLRDRVLKGENFEKLAETYSDSESRHRRGSIGWVRRGDLDPAIEKAIFALEEGVPSQPVPTPEGVHLFYVDTIVPEQELSYEAAKSRLAGVLRQERLAKLLEEELAKIEPPADSFFVDRQTFSDILRAGDDEALLLRLGDTEIKSGDFPKEIASYVNANPAKSRTDRITNEKAWQAYEQLRKTLLIEYQCKSKQLVPQADIDAELADWSSRTLVKEQRRRSLLAFAGQDQDKLDLYYKSNIGRFSGPLRVKSQVLKVPVDAHAVNTMAKLEAAAAAKGMLLADLSDLGGTVEDLGWKTVEELRLIQPKLPALISACSPGQLTSPYRNGKVLEIMEVQEKEEPQPLPFEEVRQAVVAAYTEQYTPQLYRGLLDKLVPLDKLEINPAGIESLRARDLADIDIAPEQIDELLQQLEQ